MGGLESFRSTNPSIPVLIPANQKSAQKRGYPHFSLNPLLSIKSMKQENNAYIYHFFQDWSNLWRPSPRFRNVFIFFCDCHFWHLNRVNCMIYAFINFFQIKNGLMFGDSFSGGSRLVSFQRTPSSKWLRLDLHLNSKLSVWLSLDFYLKPAVPVWLWLELLFYTRLPISSWIILVEFSIQILFFFIKEAQSRNDKWQLVWLQFQQGKKSRKL